jgi:hypothetical protein
MWSSPFDREAANDIERFRATDLMLRNTVAPLLLACVIACIDAVVSVPHRSPAIVVALSLGVVAIGFLRLGQQFRYWANTKTYEVAYWLNLDGMELPTRPAVGLSDREPKGS